MATITRVECDECGSIINESDAIKLHDYRVEMPEGSGFVLPSPQDFCEIKCIMHFLSKNTNIGVV